MSELSNIAIIGGGLAGCECARKLSRAGVAVTIFEMKPEHYSPAHTYEGLAELVCSNSFRSDQPEAAVGVLKQEMRELDSLVLEAAEATRVPAGKALAVNRELFSDYITKIITEDENITLVHKEITSLDAEELKDFDAVVLAAGPLASEALSDSLAATIDTTHLYFYDAIAPIIAADSVNMDIAFWGSRYNPDDKDYLNCALNEEEYHALREALISGEKAPTKDFEKEIHFEGCMPIEALAERGEMTLAFGSFKPVGFNDPRTGERPFALVQLRTENLNKSMFNLVGCQTKLKYKEQDRIFRMIPGLENAEFVRYGSVHRNTYVNAPKTLNTELALNNRPNVYLAGQITGVEGYVESAASGLWLGIVLAAKAKKLAIAEPPAETCLGGLLSHLRTEQKNFQPANVQFGLTPELNRKARKKERKLLYAQRARERFTAWVKEQEEALNDCCL
ncbi:methylenetetrahydrofolate--tRNA-(uracil(54)-C(5))-methyltransferase (FADH(2)-oxidizing) TrmFO [Halodesulfovibrio sp.]|uniref:methylenetetrahydrofolate--tRNA-(uracil(54)- C(5))-methyltransferase (FADH(2)-oxidizing) TrmFO n=1 Tax=Halodesulfovibrio sp. TaxID=1912772 RepID=UPI0025F288E5|nr:methylenetetrahydrofolate--tRNA-(uracil(54)-C(5))-methyltransferase (FADH(2)-oxidizing) TrmFO [Halodesulfovibrio sp.]MCT4536143.1 methylenetetrahydrofolate--tRNA-(uracil(54)-C(5))-methyltransferase (FADH(2)-oxidizing) TrmFO [Halodesulfovibrio sp.]